MKFPRIFSSRVISIFLIFLGIMFFCVLVPVVVEGFAIPKKGAAALGDQSSQKVTANKIPAFGQGAKIGTGKP